jgi:hypothetical protein
LRQAMNSHRMPPCRLRSDWNTIQMSIETERSNHGNSSRRQFRHSLECKLIWAMNNSRNCSVQLGIISILPQT